MYFHSDQLITHALPKGPTQSSGVTKKLHFSANPRTLVSAKMVILRLSNRPRRALGKAWGCKKECLAETARLVILGANRARRAPR